MHNKDFINKLTKQQDISFWLALEKDKLNETERQLNEAHNSLGEMLYELQKFGERVGKNDKYSESLHRFKSITNGLATATISASQVRLLEYKLQCLNLDNVRLKKMIVKLDEELNREQLIADNV